MIKKLNSNFRLVIRTEFKLVLIIYLRLSMVY